MNTALKRFRQDILCGATKAPMRGSKREFKALHLRHEDFAGGVQQLQADNSSSIDAVLSVLTTQRSVRRGKRGCSDFTSSSDSEDCGHSSKQAE